MKGLQAGACRTGRPLVSRRKKSEFMTSSTLTNAEELVFCQKSVNAVTTYKPLLSSFVLAGTPATPAKIQAVFQADIDATGALDSALANVANLRKAQKAARAASRQLHGNLKKYLVAVSGPEIVQIMQDFGYPASKPRTQTVASKAKQVAQAQATRDARGTKGSKQKAGIKGVVSTPATAPAAPAAAK
jgi:hypothetical protein